MWFAPPVVVIQGLVESARKGTTASYLEKLESKANFMCTVNLKLLCLP